MLGKKSKTNDLSPELVVFWRQETASISTRACSIWTLTQQLTSDILCPSLQNSVKALTLKLGCTCIWHLDLDPKVEARHIMSFTSKLGQDLDLKTRLQVTMHYNPFVPKSQAHVADYIYFQELKNYFKLFATARIILHPMTYSLLTPNPNINV